VAKKKRRGKRRQRRRGSRFPTKLVGLIVLGLLVAGGFLGWIASRPATGEEQRAVCALVVDRTTSSNDEATVEAYRRHANETLNGCRERQALTHVYFFDQANQKLQEAAGSPFALWLPEGRKQSAQENELEDTVAAAQAAVDGVFDRPAGEARGSDILAAVDAASSALASDGGDGSTDERYLVVVTDGIQLSSDVTVEDLATEDADVAPLIDRARAVDLIPAELAGVQVSIVGARGGLGPSGEQLPQWFEAKVEQFWRAVMDEAGAKTCVYGPVAAQLPKRC
jgi:hypothetical protein